MRVYMDASAATKLFAKEAESEALGAYLEDVSEAQLVSSVLLETELRRTATRTSTPQMEVTEILSRIDLLSTPRGLFHMAGLMPVPGLRSLDAIHLASAMRAAVDIVIAYDRRLVEASHYVGLAVSSPA